MLPINPHLAMVIATFIFGANYVVGRAVAGEVPPYTVGFVRWFVALVLILPFTLRHVKADWRTITAGWRPLTACGFLMPFMGAGITYVALTKTVAVNAGIVQTSLPIFTLILSWILLGDRITARQAIGTVLAIVGVLGIVARGDPAVLASLEINTGDLILIVCNLGLAAYGVMIKKVPSGLHPLSILTVVFAVGAICHVPFAGYEVFSGQWPTGSTVSILGLVFVALFPSVVAIFCWNRAIDCFGPGKAGMYMNLVPVFAAALAVPFLGETLELFHVIGGLLIVGGVMLSTRTAR